MAYNPDTPTPEFVKKTNEKVTKQVEALDKDMSHRNYSVKKREQNFKENLIEARVQRDMGWKERDNAKERLIGIIRKEKEEREGTIDDLKRKLFKERSENERSVWDYEEKVEGQRKEIKILKEEKERQIRYHNGILNTVYDNFRRATVERDQAREEVENLKRLAQEKEKEKEKEKEENEVDPNVFHIENLGEYVPGNGEGFDEVINAWNYMYIMSIVYDEEEEAKMKLLRKK